MDVLEELKTLGANIEEGLKRLNNNEKLYKKLLNSFVKAINTNYIGADFDSADIQSAIEKTHTIKGTAGNLSITPIYEAYSRIVDLLRSDKPEEARAELEKILPVQESIIHCIEKHAE